MKGCVYRSVFSTRKYSKLLPYSVVYHIKVTILLGHHHFDELLVVDLTISIDIRLTDHFINLLIGELLTQVGHHMPQLRSRDETIAITVKDLEGFDELFLCISVLHLAGHQREELWEVDGAVTIGINFVDHILKLSFSRILAQGAHDSSQLLSSDGAITILVKEREGLLEFSNLLLSQPVRHCGLVAGEM